MTASEREKIMLKSSLRLLSQAAKSLLFLHMCEQEGLTTGQPSKEMWLSRVDNLERILNEHGDLG